MKEFHLLGQSAKRKAQNSFENHFYIKYSTNPKELFAEYDVTITKNKKDNE